MSGFEVVYADPPWRYSFSKSKSRQVENQYPTMTTSEICALDIPCANNAVLYLWATAPKLEDALCVLKAWGFTYKTHAVWDKKRTGMGYWFRGRHELLLVGVKGKFSPPEPSLRIDSVIEEARGQHSSKPDCVRMLIASWFPDARRVELFARTTVEGWYAWGNEIESTVRIENIAD